MRKYQNTLFILIVLLFTSCFGFAQDEKFIPLGKRAGSCYGLKKVWSPEWFQGNKKTKNYFEGWYFKVVSDDGTFRYAFIPGISLGNDEHSFIQMINGNNGKTDYFRFPIDSFSFSKNRFAVKVGSNFFSADSFHVDIGEGDQRLYANIKNDNLTAYPIKPCSPGIMGWYRFVPFMECFHGVVSINHTVTGQLIIGRDSVNITKGKGYIEKDWGKSMPSAWVWSQSNNFTKSPNTSFMLSIANIPWMGRSFTGFLGYLSVNNELYRFATYTRAKIKEFNINGDTIRVIIKESKFTIHFEGVRGRRGELLAPVKGDMSRTIHESIDANIRIKLFDRKGNLLFEDVSTIAGLELVGETNKLKR